MYGQGWSARRLKAYAVTCMEQERYMTARKALYRALQKVSDRERAGMLKLWYELNGIIIVRCALKSPLEVKNGVQKK